MTENSREPTQEERELQFLRSSFARVYGLTNAEMDVVHCLGSAWNEYQKLPSVHESDEREFLAAIHQCQNIVMSRLAGRVHPEVFSNSGRQRKAE